MRISREIFQQGVDLPPTRAKVVFNQLIDAGAKNFANTALVNKKSFTPDDIQAISAFYTEAAEISSEIFNPSTQTHLLLTGRYCRLFGGHFNEKGYNFNLDELEALGLLHDIGRTFSHRQHRNDLIGDLILRRSGVRPDVIRNIPPEEKWWPEIENGEINTEASARKLAEVHSQTVVNLKLGIGGSIS